MIYFDNAATTAMSEAALQALIEVSKNQYGNPSSVYSYGRKTKELLEEARRIVADCIGAAPEEIFFTSCGTESDNWAINQAIVGKKKVITSQIEHHAVLRPVQQCEKFGISTSYIPVDNKCIVYQGKLKESLDGSAALVSVMLQNNETGVIQHIQELAKLVHEDNKQSIFHTDAVQAVGHIPIDVKKLGVDMLSASAHKFNGPKGVGFLYITKNCQVNPFVLGGGQEKGMRSGTENVACIYAMAKALEDNVNNMEINCNHIRLLEKMFLTSLSNEDVSYVVNADGNQRATGIINISIKGIDGEGLLNMLDMHDICISVGSACNTQSKNRSHVLRAMGMDDKQIDASVRISMGRYNSEDDVKKLVKCIKKYYKVMTLIEA